MKNILKAFSLLLIFISASAAAQSSIGSIEQNFKNISWGQPIGVYWYWVGGNMSEEGIVKDLHAMKDAGITRVQIGMIGDGQGIPLGPLKMFTDDWWNILHTMFKTAGELGIEVGLFNCPGWSQSGGPWVKPSQAMRYLATVKDTLSGPVKYHSKLPDVGENSQDVKVLAYPLIEPETNLSSGDVSSLDVIRLRSESPVSVRTVVLEFVPKTGETDVELFADGKRVLKTYADRSNAGVNVGFDPFAPVVVSIPETVGREFVIKLEKAGVISQVTLSDVPAVERYPEKTFAKMWQTPHPMWE